MTTALRRGRAVGGAVLLSGVLGALAMLQAAPARADPALWQTIARGGYVLLIRHASTDAGTGDPPGFRIDDCATQRNLSASGRAEARRLGDAFRRQRVPIAEVRSSPWCRCLDTARLAFDRAAPWPALSSLFHDDRQAEAQRREVMSYARGQPANGNLVLVTHNVNIRALTGVSPVPGEIVVTRYADDGLRVVGRLPPNAH